LSLDADRAARGVGVETSALWPVIPGNLFVLRAAIPVAWSGRVQILVGAQGHIPHDREDEGRFSTLAMSAGLRTYFWKGLHVDVSAVGGLGRLRKSVETGRDYDSFDLELFGVAGWRFEAGPVYALVQPLGLASVVYRSNPWPVRGEGTRRTEPPIYVANVALGVQFW
jgi:hypothetical protein